MTRLRDALVGVLAESVVASESEQLRVTAIETMLEILHQVERAMAANGKRPQCSPEPAWHGTGILRDATSTLPTFLDIVRERICRYAQLADERQRKVRATALWCDETGTKIVERVVEATYETHCESKLTIGN